MRIKNPDTFETTNNIFIPDGAKGEKGDQGAAGTNGKDGVDGKSPTISTKDNGNGSHTITITNPDGSTTSFEVKNGQKGDKGDKGDRGETGAQGAAGANGKDAAPLTVTKTEKDKDGNTVVTLSDGTVLNIAKGDKGDQGLPGEKGAKGDKGDTGAAGANGKDGVDGKSPEVSTAETPDGHTITIKNPDGTTTSFEVKNGQKGEKGDKGDRGERGLQGERGAQGAAGADGKSPLISTKDNGDGSHTITITNPDGSTTTTTIKDGKNGSDGKDAAPLTVTKTEKDKDGNTVVTLSDGTVLNIAKGDKGDQGPQGEKGAKGDKGDTGAAGANGKDGVDGKSPEVSTAETPDGHTITIKNPDGSTTSFEVKNGQKGDKGDKGDRGETGAQGVAGTNGKDGKDGKSLTVTHTAKDDQGNTLVTLSDGTVLTIAKGDKGEKGDKGDRGERGAQGIAGSNGKDGKDGKDGKTYLPVVERTSYGNLINFYPVNPETGKVDTSKEPVARAIVKDGLDGLAPKITARRNATNDGVIITVTPQVRGTDRSVSDDTPEVTELKDGKSPDVDVTTDANGNHVVTITKTNGKQKSVTITNGKDGKAPIVETLPGKDSQGHSGTKILVKHPETGAVISESFVRDGKDGKDGRDGKDGKAPIVETKPGQDRAGQTGAYILVKNPETGAVISETFISDGKDGESPKVETTPATNEKGEKGHYISFIHPKTGQTFSKVFVKDGKDGKDGQDGLTPDIKPVFDKNGKQIGVEISLTDRKGKLLSREFIYNGEDGQTPIIETEPSDNPKQPGTKIIYKNPKTGEVIRQVFVRDGKDGKDGKDGRDGRDGRDGKDAQGVEKITVNNNGDLVIINSNHTTQVIPRPNQGGIKDAKVDEAGHLIISLDAGRTIDAGLVRGKDGRDGRDGKDGKDGKDGRGIKNVKLTDNGDFIVVYTDYSIEVAGNVCGTCPNPSKPSHPDQPSPDKPGKKGKPETPEKPGTPDQPGTPDKPGKHDQPATPDKPSDQGDKPKPKDKEKTPEIPHEKPSPAAPAGPRPRKTEEEMGDKVQEEIPSEHSDYLVTTSLHKKKDTSVKTYTLTYPKAFKASENASLSIHDNNALPSQEAKQEVAEVKSQATSLPKTGSEADSTLPVLLAAALLLTGTGLVTISKKDESLH
ncbi:collagen-flanked surface repeat-containing protein [Aerococcus urinae]